MNDPFEDRLRSLQPGALPNDLACRLDRPPVEPARRWERRVVFAAAAAVAATVAAVGWHALTPPPGAEISQATERAAPPAFAGQRRTEVTRVRPVSVITDEHNQPWRLVEVNWVEEDTVVYADHPAAVRTRDQYHTIVPVALRLD